MNCPDCGAWSDVAETRAAPHHMLKRRRVCANGHRFNTFEVLPPVVRAAGSNVAGASRAARSNAARWVRDQTIRFDSRPLGEIARDYDLSAERVRQIKRAANQTGKLR